MSNFRIELFYPLISTSIWGISIVVAKIIESYGYQPMEIVFGRFLLASIIFIPILFMKRKSVGYRPNTKSIWLALLGLSITGVSVNNLIFYLGLNFTTATSASLLMSLNPLMTMIFAVILLGEKFDRKKLISVILGILGVSLILGFSFHDFGQLKGNLFIILAISIWGLSFSFSKIASDQGLSSIAVTGYSEILGAIIILPFFLHRSSLSIFRTTNLTVIGGFCFIGIFSSVLAYIIYYRSIRIYGPGLVAPAINIMPFAGSIAAFFILKEQLHGYLVIGFLLVLSGVLLVQSENIRFKGILNQTKLAKNE